MHGDPDCCRVTHLSPPPTYLPTYLPSTVARACASHLGVETTKDQCRPQKCACAPVSLFPFIVTIVLLCVDVTADGGKTAPPKPTKPKCPPNMINPFACQCGTEKTTTDAGCPKVQCRPCEYKSLRIGNGHVHSRAP